MPLLGEEAKPKDKETDEFIREWKAKNLEPIEKPVHFFDKLRNKIKELSVAK